MAGVKNKKTTIPFDILLFICERKAEMGLVGKGKGDNRSERTQGPA